MVVGKTQRQPLHPSTQTSDSESHDYLTSNDSTLTVVIRYHYKPQEIERLAKDPEYLLLYRKKIEFALNSGFQIFYKDSMASRITQQYMAAEMARRLNYHPVLTERLIPSWPVGCR